MTARLSQQSQNCYSLQGLVTHDQAAALAAALPSVVGRHLTVELDRAEGGTLLLLVLLDWLRQVQQRDVTLTFSQPSESLIKAAVLSGLDSLLPFAFPSH